MRIRPIVIIVFVLAIMGIAAFTLMVQRSMSFDTVTAREAADRFEEIREQFGDAEALLVLREDGSGGLRDGADTSDGDVPATSLHLMVLQPPDRLLTAEMPLWLFRLKGRTWLRFSGRSDVDLEEIGLDPEDLKRMGPRLLFDADMPEGHMMMWSE